MILFLFLYNIDHVLAGGSETPRNQFWVGSHPFGETEHARTIRNTIGTRYSAVEAVIQMNTDLYMFFHEHTVKIDTGIGAMPRDRVYHWNTASYSAVAVMSGVGADRVEDIETYIYLGPKSSQFSVHSTSLRMRNNNSYPQASKFVELLLVYALIREAHRRCLDFASYIAPLKTAAQSLLPDVRGSQPDIARQVSADLLNLVPSEYP